MRTFDHIGLPTSVVQPNERFVARTRVYVTAPHTHPYRVEWLRYLPESIVPERMRYTAHIAFHVDDIDRESAGLKVLLPPCSSVAGHRVGFFESDDGAILEFMEFS